MFYLVDAKNVLVKESDTRIALRRRRRKLPKTDKVRIIEGTTLANALKQEEKAKAPKGKKVDSPGPKQLKLL